MASQTATYGFQQRGKVDVYIDGAASGLLKVGFNRAVNDLNLAIRASQPCSNAMRKQDMRMFDKP
jgi:hypothetical protein